MKPTKIILHLIFLAIAAMVLIGTFTENPWMNYPVKPLIMAWIATYFLLMTRPQPYRWLVVLAFFFSWTGDILLMLAWKSDLLFFAGVGSFFLSQLTYIQVFRQFGCSKGRGFILRNPLWLIPFLAYLAGIYFYLAPDIEGIMKPIIALYAISLMSMAIAALNRKGLVVAGSFSILFAGSLFFMLSDSLLAINKFSAPLPHSGFLVLSTYMLAQYLIMVGLVRSGK